MIGDQLIVDPASSIEDVLGNAVRHGVLSVSRRANSVRRSAAESDRQKVEEELQSGAPSPGYI